MDWKKLLFNDNEQPLDSFVTGISNTAVFRTIGFIGDSLSSGEFESRDSEGKAGYHDLFEYSWGQYIARKNGLKAYNFSKGGMTASEYIKTFADKMLYWERARDCQCFVIALGVNDILNRGDELGSLSDIGDDSKETFAYYYSAIIEKLKAIQPRAKFFFVTMPRSESVDSNAKKEKHAELLHAFAAHYDNCYVVDLFRYAPVYDAAFKEKFYLYGHMNASGYILTANMVDSYIDYIVRHNPDDFRRVAYIGTDLV